MSSIDAAAPAVPSTPVQGWAVLIKAGPVRMVRYSRWAHEAYEDFKAQCIEHDPENVVLVRLQTVIEGGR